MAKNSGLVAFLFGLLAANLLSVCDRSSSQQYEYASDYYAVAKGIAMDLSLLRDNQGDVQARQIVLGAYSKLGSPTSRYRGDGTEFRFNPNPAAYDGVWSEQGSADRVIVVARKEKARGGVFAVKADGSYCDLPWQDEYAEWIDVSAGQ